MFHKWTRCGEYKIEQVKTDRGLRSYIRPVPDSGFIKYDFMDVHRKQGSRRMGENTIVPSLVNLDTSNEKAILNFVNQFGLLGLLPYNYLEPMLLELGTERKLIFIPERRGKNIADVSEVEREYLFALNGRNYTDLIHSVSEPLEEFKKAVLRFQDLNNHVSAVGLNRGIAVNDNGEWILEWSFDSLLSAAYFFLDECLLSNFWIGTCPRCSKYFLSSVKTQNYCSRRCDDAERKAKSRQALKERVIIRIT
ncbi:hypothetical protein [Desulfosporosinus sp.]|uniref:hypothetical protein n=1 Tax=Desulfosporosinus sp. TaxID=157907 RepID=UPI002616DEAD|nr:hypothetical protein [Desulfosporosinus sp.]